MSKLLEKDRNKLGLVHYEVQMFRCMYEYLQRKNGFSRSLHNAILESFLIHVRNLIDFFHGTIDQPPYKKVCNDIIVSDFKDQNGGDLCLVKKTDWRITSQNKQKINKFLSHLSEERLIEDENWEEEIRTFKTEIEGKLENFLQKISDEYFPFRKDKKEIAKTNFGRYEESFSNCIQKIENKIGDSKSQFSGFTNTTSDL